MRPSLLESGRSSRFQYDQSDSSSPSFSSTSPPPSTNHSTSSNMNPALAKRRLLAEKMAIREREKIEQEKRKNEIKKQKEHSEKVKIWNEEILPNWNDYVGTSKLRELCYRGIPANIRCKVWPLLISNDAEVTEELYESLCMEALVLFHDKMSATRKSSTPLQSPIKSVETPKRKPKNLNINTNIENTSNNTNSNTNSNEPTENDSTSDPTDTTSTSSSSITNLPTPPSISSPDKNLKKFGLNNINNDNSLTSEEILCLDSPKREEISKNLLLFSPISSSSAPSFREKHSNSFLVNNGLLADKPEFSFPISTSNITPSKLPSSPSNSSRSSSSASIASLNPTLEKIYNTVSLIQWDLPRTYPTLGFFHDGGLMHVGLERILLCYSLYCPEIGYVQGMSFLVGNLLLYLNEYNSFKLFINILNKKIINNFYSLKKNYIDSYVLCFNYFFKKILPLLYNYLQQEDISSEMFLIDWNLSLFTKSLPLEVAAYIWDIYFLEGEITLLIVSLSLLKLYGSYISTLKMEDILSFLLHLPENINQDELKENINSIRLLISKKLYNKIRAEKINEVNKKLNENMSSYHSSSVSSVAGSTLSISPYSTTSSISSPSTYISSLSASLFPNICSVCQVDIVNCICNENTSDLRKKTHSIVSVSGASIISTSATSSSSSSSSAAILSLSTPSNTSSSSNGSNKNGISPIDDFSSVTSTPSSTPNEPKKKKSQSESSCIPS